MKRIPLGHISNMQPQVPVHESKPIRAGIASVLSLPGTIQQLGGTIITGITTPFTDKSFTENLADSYLFKSGTNTVNKVHDVLGANKPEDQDHAEQVAAFVGDLIPTIATRGSYGAIKLAGNQLTKAATKNLTKGMTKKATKAFKDKASSKLAQEGLDKQARLEALKQAKLETRDSFSHPLKTGAEFLLPGLQIPKTEQLVRASVLKGMTRDAALKAAHKRQLISGGAQLGLAAGIYEGLAALTDEQGLVGNYIDEPETFDLEQQLNESERSNLVPALVGGLGAFVGYKGSQKLTKNRINDVIEANKRIEHVAKTSQQWAANNNVEDTLASRYSDKTTVLDNPEFNYLIDDDHIGLVRADLGTEIAKMYDTGDVGFGIDNKTSFRQIEQGLRSLQKDAPERYNLISNYLDKAHELQNMAYDYNFQKMMGTVNENNYKAYLRNEEVFNLQDMSSDIHKLRKEVMDLQNEIKQDPKLYKLLQDISDSDKILFKLAQKSGKFSQAEYDYLLNNRTIDGIFSYKPRIAKPVDETTLQKLVNPAKRFFVDSEYSDDFNNMLKAQRTKYDPALETLSYLDTYNNKVKQVLYSVTANAIRRSTLPHMLKNQEKELLTHFSDIAALRLSQIHKPKKMTPEKMAKYEKQRAATLDRVVKEADSATRVKYLGYRDIRNTKDARPAKNVFDYLNRSTYKGQQPEFIEKYFKAQHPYKNETNFAELIGGKSRGKNTEIVSFFDESGIEHFFEVHKLLGSVLDYSPEMLNAFQHTLKAGKQVFQKFTTGNLNPVFALTSPVYAAFESITVLPTLLNKHGFDYNIVKDSYDLMKHNIKAAKMRYTNQVTQNIIDSWKRADLLNVSGDSTDPILKQYTEAQIRDMELALQNTLLSKAQRAGAVTFKYTDDTTDRTFNLDISVPFSEKFSNAVHKRFGHKAEQVLKMFGVVQECLRNAGNDGLLLYLAGRKNIQSKEELRKLADSISKSITDSKRRGNYSNIDGALVGGIAKYAAYGNVMIQSIAGKLHAANAKDGYNFIKTATEQVKKSDKKWIDIVCQLQIGADALKNNKFIHGLVATAGIPATICYLWNHSTDSQRENYYKLSDYDKASKYIFTNFWGTGRHLSIPVDQEVAVVAKLVETMLDSVFQGSKMQDVDPAFEQHRLIMQALSRSLNIENLVYPELLLNASGYQSAFDPATLSGNNSFISTLPPNQTNLDGSKTAIQNGIFSQQSRAIINTMFGSLGNALAGGVEQANIGTRDVGIVQGTTDFLSGTGRSLFKSVPFVPMDNKFTIRSSNQTHQQNKQKQETIHSLKKLRTFVENNNNSEFGRRKNNKVPNMAALQPLTPDLQKALQIADVAVPVYNERIAPIFDEISAVYKQVAAFNATGRDRFGNIVNAGDRLSFQQRRNEQIQKLHARIHEEFLNLEQQLTNAFGRDITLNDFDKLKGV